jgi:HSP20 family protein
MTGLTRPEDRDANREWVPLQWEVDRLAQPPMRPVVRRGVRVFPSIIISATDEKVVVQAEVPGMKLADFDISVSGETLTVQGVRLTGEGLEGGWYHRRERESGGFSRAIRLPVEVDGDTAEATYMAGVLTISLVPKKPAKPRAIPVKVVEG